MNRKDLENNTPEELLELYADILNELNDRKILRTYNSPVGDYAEWLVYNKLNLKLVKNSEKGYDGIDDDKKNIKSKADGNEESRVQRVGD